MNPMHSRPGSFNTSANRIEVYVEGIEDIRRALDMLPKAAEQNTLVQCLKNAFKPMLDVARGWASLRVGGGKFSKSLHIAKSRRNHLGAVCVMIKPNPKETHIASRDHHKMGFITRSSKIAHLLELGTKPHWLTPKKKGALARESALIASAKMKRTKAHIANRFWGLHPGTPPRPFLVPAWASNIQQTEESFEKQIWDVVDQIMAATGNAQHVP
jgi:hypothetical protein